MVLHGLQHHLNALHVMARLVHLGLPSPRALALARWWERLVHPLLYLVVRPLRRRTA
jgi:aryl carrier-like protein